MVAAIGVGLALFVLFGLGILPLKRGSQISHRLPVLDLGYCGSTDAKPCIVSFSLDAQGRMLVNILTPNASFPKFYLKITHNKGESLYECSKVKGSSTSVSCVGEGMQPGEVLQFSLVSAHDDTLLATGSFSIVGLALATPEINISSPTPGEEATSSGEPTASPTAGPGPIERTPTPIRPDPSPSYPNPSYPNPSYP